jgi:hypothetical protein
LQPCDVAVVLLLVLGKDLSAWSAFAFSEVAKVKVQNGEAGVCEPFRKLGQAISLVVPIPCAIAIAGNFASSVAE